MTTLRHKELDGWAYCVEHDECTGDGDGYVDDLGDPACRAWEFRDDAEQPCRFVPILIQVIS